MPLLGNILRGRGARPLARDDHYTLGENDSDVFRPTLNDDANHPWFPFQKKITALDLGTFKGQGQIVQNGNRIELDAGNAYDYLGAGESATAVLTYTIRNAWGGWHKANIHLTIAGENDAPDAQDIAVSIGENSPLTFSALYTDPDTNDTHTVSVDDTGLAGTLVWDAQGVFDYDPGTAFDALAAGETATDSFTYTVDDGNGGTDTATVTITLIGADEPASNQAPVFQGGSGDWSSPSAVQLASVTSGGAQSSTHSFGYNISATGRFVLFTNAYEDLVSSDLNATGDVFVRDVETGLTHHIDLSSLGGSLTYLDEATTISGDGRVIVGLHRIDGPSGPKNQVYAHDRLTGTNTVISENPVTGDAGNGESARPTLSADGRFVAFYSDADNLVAGDTNGAKDVFLYDRDTGSMKLVARGESNVLPLASDGYASLSGDGRYLVFNSPDQLTADDTNAASDIYVYDRVNDTFELVTRGLGGQTPDGLSDAANISADGRFIVYLSAATNLVAGDTNGKIDAFVYDRTTGVTERVNVGPSGAQSNSHAIGPDISGDGRYVAFGSFDASLDPSNSQNGIFVHDRLTGETRLVSSTVTGTNPDFGFTGVAISDDGTSVMVSSQTTTFVPNDTNGASDAFVITSGILSVSELPDTDPDANQITHTLTDVINFTDADLSDTHTITIQPAGSNYYGNLTATMVDSTGTGAGTITWTYTVDDSDLEPLQEGQTIKQTYRLIIDDGQATDITTVSILLEGEADNMPPKLGSANTQGDVFELADNSPGEYTSVVRDDGAIAFTDTPGDSHTLTVTPQGGSYLGFFQATLVPIDANGAGSVTWDFEIADADIDDLAAGETIEQHYSIEITDQAGGSVALPVSITITGANDAPLVAGQSGWGAIASVERANLDAAGQQALAGDSYAPSVSADGRYIAFYSHADDLVAGDTNGAADVFVKDLQTGAIERVSVDSAGAEANGFSGFPVISANGRFVAFHSGADNLVGGDVNGYYDVFVHDRQTGQTEIVSIQTDGTPGSNHSYVTDMSSDGRYVTFYSASADFAGGDLQGAWEAYLYDRHTDTLELISADPGGGPSNGNSFSPSVSDDGRFVAFNSNGSDLGSGSTNGVYDVYVRDRLSGGLELVSAPVGGGESNGNSAAQSLSGNGQFVVFSSLATNLVGGDTNGANDIFVYDIAANQLARVSVASDGTQADGDSFEPVISDDGRFIFFHSDATNLVADDTNGSSDIFVHDRLTGETQRISEAGPGVQVNGDSEGVAISADGRTVAFHSVSDDLVGGDTNAQADVFVVKSGGTNLDATIIELEDGDAQENILLHSAGDTIAFSDADLSDTHSVQIIEGDTGYLGSLSAIVNDSTGTGAGTIDWVFEVSDSALDGLDEGETRLQTYTLELHDGHAMGVVQVEIFLIGTDDVII